jgi:hypothetical protein
MKLIRTKPRVGGKPHVRVYSCTLCGVGYTESERGPAEVLRAISLHQEWCVGIQ